MNGSQPSRSEELANPITSGAGLVFAVAGAVVPTTLAGQYGTVWNIASCSG